jgi:hypothetical protein
MKRVQISSGKRMKIFFTKNNHDPGAMPGVVDKYLQ